MTEDKKKTYDDDLDLEKILSPRCEFRVSSGFKDRVMAEAHSIPKRRRLLRIPYIAYSVAAAAVAIIVMTTLHFRKPDTAVEMPQITATTENQATIPSDTIKINPKTQLLAATTQEDAAKGKVSKTIPTKKDRTLQYKSSKPIILEEELTGADPQPVTEGEMPMINREKSLDPDEVRSRLIEIRRNAEIAYIEQVRDEIEANQAYIAQLMNEENVYQ